MSKKLVFSDALDADYSFYEKLSDIIRKDQINDVYFLGDIEAPTSINDFLKFHEKLYCEGRNLYAVKGDYDQKWIDYVSGKSSLESDLFDNEFLLKNNLTIKNHLLSLLDNYKDSSIEYRHTLSEGEGAIELNPFIIENCLDNLIENRTDFLIKGHSNSQKVWFNDESGDHFTENMDNRYDETIILSPPAIIQVGSFKCGDYAIIDNDFTDETLSVTYCNLFKN